MDEYDFEASDSWYMIEEVGRVLEQAQWRSDDSDHNTTATVTTTNFNFGNSDHPLEGENVAVIRSMMNKTCEDGGRRKGEACVYLNEEQAKQVGFALLACAGELRDDRKI